MSEAKKCARCAREITEQETNDVVRFVSQECPAALPGLGIPCELEPDIKPQVQTDLFATGAIE